MIFLVLLIGVMAPIPVDEYVASLPAMVGYFDSSASAMQLSISAFLFALGVGQVVLGPLSDRYGRRIVLIVGITIYLAGTAVCTMSDTVWLVDDRPGSARTWHCQLRHDGDNLDRRLFRGR